MLTLSTPKHHSMIHKHERAICRLDCVCMVRWLGTTWSIISIVLIKTHSQLWFLARLLLLKWFATCTQAVSFYGLFMVPAILSIQLYPLSLASKKDGGNKRGEETSGEIWWRLTFVLKKSLHVEPNIFPLKPRLSGENLLKFCMCAESYMSSISGSDTAQ